MSRFRIKRGSGKQRVQGTDFRLSDEVHYIQRCAAQCDARIVTIRPLLLFSTATGDAWPLDPADQLATPIARDGDALSVQIEDTDTNFAVAWKGSYRIDGAAFVFEDSGSGTIRTILGYPTDTNQQPNFENDWLARSPRNGTSQSPRRNCAIAQIRKLHTA